MLRTFCALIVLCGSAALALSVAAPASGVSAAQPAKGADPAPAGPAGNWKLIVPTKDDDIVMLVAIAEKDGKWTAEFLGSAPELKTKPVVTSVKVTGDSVVFTLGIGDRELINFDGALSKDGKRILGSFTVVGGPLRTTALRRTKLTKLDDTFAVLRDELDQADDGPELFSLAFQVLTQAGEKKVPADDVRAIVDRVNKAAAAYGPRWEREVTLKLIEALASQEGLADLAVAQAKRAERLLTDDDTTATRLAVLDAIIRTLTKVGKADDAKPYLAQIPKLELRDYAEYLKTSTPFKTEPFAGRKGKSDRTAVVEVFTEANHDESVGPLLAYDAVMRTFKPADVIVLQYHIPIEDADPLMCAAGVDRVRQYGDDIRGVPAVFVSGKASPVRGGGRGEAEKAYNRIRSDVEELLEKPAPLKLTLSVSKGEKGDFSVKATVADLEMPGEKMVLRFVLVEDRVRYAGGNGLRYHHMVVRAMPGGSKGVSLTKKNHEETVSIDPEAIKADLAKYLDGVPKQFGPFPRPDRPLSFRNLKVVALVQNDATKEILHAVQVNLEVK